MRPSARTPTDAAQHDRVRGMMTNFIRGEMLQQGITVFLAAKTRCDYAADDRVGFVMETTHRVGRTADLDQRGFIVQVDVPRAGRDALPDFRLAVSMLLVQLP